MDYASLTPIDPKVLRVMEKYSTSSFANPSSIYSEGVAAMEALSQARQVVADFLHAHNDEIFFTASGTEANNLALRGVFDLVESLAKATANKANPPHLIISNIEHSSIGETATALEKIGVAVTRLAVDDRGLIDPATLKQALRPETRLVSIMMVNNEIGTVQPLKELAKVVRQYRQSRSTDKSFPLLHTDAAQAAICHDLNVVSLGVDMMTIDGGKLYGPHGIGALYVKRGLSLQPVIYGGGQERGLRSGTENLPGIAGLAEAIRLVMLEQPTEIARLHDLKLFFGQEFKQIYPEASINPRLNIGKDSDEFVDPHILNISVPNLDKEFFVLQLDARGVAISTRSSCLRDAEESYVLQALGLAEPLALRFSFGRYTKPADLRRVLRVIRDIKGLSQA